MRGMIVALAVAGALAAAVFSGVDPTSIAGAEPANSADGGGASFGASCDRSHRAVKDPITNPSGSSDSTHLHEFYGNTSTDNFNYADMLAAPSTCNRGGVQGSAYWFPTVRWNETQLQPKNGIIYYKHNNKRHESVRPFPRSLKMIVDQGEGAIRWQRPYGV